MRLIGINEVVFAATITNMKTTGNAIDGSIKTWMSQGEKSKAFTKFQEDYRILQEIMQEYKKLVLKDVATVTEVGAKISNLDNELLRVWR